MIGIALTIFSAVRSSRIAQFALIALVVVGAILLYGRSKRKQGVAEAVARAAAAVTKRMERNRIIHAEIKRLPLSERAERLRKLGMKGADDG